MYLLPIALEYFGAWFVLALAVGAALGKAFRD
jgi:hypothetical protein